MTVYYTRMKKLLEELNNLGVPKINVVVCITVGQKITYIRQIRI